MQFRHEFTLFGEELEYLNLNFPNWEAIRQSGLQWLLLSEFPIPDGYTVRQATAAIQIPLCYPDEALDMVYFYPHLKRVDGKLIRCTDSHMIIDNKEYQRWSRHYSLTPWRLHEDSIITHVMAIKDWLRREFREVRQ